MSLTTTKAQVERKIDDAEKKLAESYELRPDDPAIADTLRAQAEALIAVARAIMFAGERIDMALSDIGPHLEGIHLEVADRRGGVR